MFKNLTAKGKLVFGLLGLVLVFGVLWATGLLGSLTSAIEGTGGRGGDGETFAAVDGDCIDIGVMPWVGYAGGQYWNGGFADSERSRFREAGICVNYVASDSRQAQIAAFKSGDLDVIWQTMDAYGPEVGDLPPDTRAFLQANKSAGGDVMIAREGINSLNDLRGKKIATAYRNPSHTLTLFALETANLKPYDVTLVEAQDPIQAVQMFKAGAVDAAAVWTPDDVEALEKVPGSSRIFSTKEAGELIHDVFLVREGWANAHERELEALFEGWMRGAVAVETDPAAREEAIQIMAAGYDMPVDFFEQTFDNAYRTNAADNECFFGITPKGTDGCAVGGADVYDNAVRLYEAANVVRGTPPPFESLVWTRAVENVAPRLGQTAQRGPDFAAPTAQDERREAISTKGVSVTFPSGSAQLTPQARQTIDAEFGTSAQLASNARVRIIGNTDDVGEAAANQALSERRAQAVADYLAQRYQFDRDRFVVRGDGESNPISPNATPAGREANRRTDLELVAR